MATTGPNQYYLIDLFVGFSSGDSKKDLIPILFDPFEASNPYKTVGKMLRLRGEYYSLN